MVADETAKTSTRKMTNAEKTRMGRLQKRQYYERKQKYLIWDESNFERVGFCHDRDVWWKTFNHSTVYYKKLIAERLGKKVNPIPDTDYGLKADGMVLNFKSLEELKEEAEKLGLKIDPKSNEHFFAIILNKKVTPEEYELMVKEDEAELEMAVRQIRPLTAWPKLKKEIMMLLKLAKELDNKFNGPQRNELGFPMYAEAREMFRIFARASRGTQPALDALLDMAEIEADLETDFLILVNLNYAKTSKAAEFGKAIRDVKDSIEREIKKETKKMKAAKNEKGLKSRENAENMDAK